MMQIIDAAGSLKCNYWMFLYCFQLRLRFVATQLVDRKKVPPKHQESELRQHIEHSRAFMTVAVICILLQGGLLFLALFEPGLPYIVSNPRGDALDSEQFLRTLIAVTDAQFGEQTKLEVFTNGSNYYPAELNAIKSAQKSICLEAYIFVPGEVTHNFIEALAERARAGVKVRLVTDAVGSHNLTGNDLKPLTDAGGRYAWYQPLKWYTWPKYNNRTHRELLIVDGQVGFVGGSGWADHWWKPVKKEKQ